MPAALLVNGGTRSGKEVFAYRAKKYRLAKLVSEGLVDGENLVGRGTDDDVIVPFDIRSRLGRTRNWSARWIS